MDRRFFISEMCYHFYMNQKKIESGIDGQEQELAADAVQEDKKPTPEDYHDFLAQFSVTPEVEQKRAEQLAKDPTMLKVMEDRNERIKYPEAWQRTLEESKAKAVEQLGKITALEDAFKKLPQSDVMLLIKVDSNGKSVKVEASKEVHHEILNTLELFINDCSEVRIPKRFYGTDVEGVHFISLFPASGGYRTSPSDFFALAKEALESAKEVE